MKISFDTTLYHTVSGGERFPQEKQLSSEQKAVLHTLIQNLDSHFQFRMIEVFMIRLEGDIVKGAVVNFEVVLNVEGEKANVSMKYTTIEECKDVWRINRHLRSLCDTQLLHMIALLNDRIRKIVDFKGLLREHPEL